MKLVSHWRKSFSFSVKLIGYDGTLKKELSTFDPQKIFDLIDSMPVSKDNTEGKVQPLNLSLYSDYKPETTLKGLGFKNRDKAIYTIDAIKDRDTRYQVNVVSTMLGRAKKHPNKTPDMDDAILDLEKWMLDYQKTRLELYKRIKPFL